MAQHQQDSPSPTAPSRVPALLAARNSHLLLFQTHLLCLSLSAEQDWSVEIPVAAQSLLQNLDPLCLQDKTWMAGWEMQQSHQQPEREINRVKIYLAPQLCCQGSVSIKDYKHFLSN